MNNIFIPNEKAGHRKTLTTQMAKENKTKRNSKQSSGDRDAALREEIARTVKEIMMKTKKQEE